MVSLDYRAQQELRPHQQQATTPDGGFPARRERSDHRPPDGLGQKGPLFESARLRDGTQLSGSTHHRCVPLRLPHFELFDQGEKSRPLGAHRECRSAGGQPLRQLPQHDQVDRCLFQSSPQRSRFGRRRLPAARRRAVRLHRRPREPHGSQSVTKSVYESALVRNRVRAAGCGRRSTVTHALLICHRVSRLHVVDSGC